MIPGTSVPSLILIILSSDACSPCYTFAGNDKSKAKLSADDLKDILLWAAKSEPTMPEILFLAGDDEPLEGSVASILEDMGEQVVTVLLPLN